MSSIYYGAPASCGALTVESTTLSTSSHYSYSRAFVSTDGINLTQEQNQTWKTYISQAISRWPEQAEYGGTNSEIYLLVSSTTQTASDGNSKSYGTAAYTISGATSDTKTDAVTTVTRSNTFEQYSLSGVGITGRESSSEHQLNIALKGKTIQSSVTKHSTLLSVSYYPNAGQSESNTYGVTWYYETTVNSAGTTTSSSYSRASTRNTYSSNLTTTLNPGPVADDTSSGNSGSTSNTDTNWVQEGWSVVDGYASTTSSYPAVTEYAGGTLGGTASSIQHTVLTSTISNVVGTTTASYITTTLATASTVSRSIATTTTATRNQTQTVWSGSNTATQTFSQTLTSSTSRSASNGEVITEGQTFLLYAGPTLKSERHYTQTAVAVANTAVGEFFWDCSSSFGYFEDGYTAPSIAFTGRTSSRLEVASVRTLNDTDTWPEATFSCTQVGGGSPSAVTSTGFATASELSVTVLAGATNTVDQTFARTVNTVTNDVATVGTLVVTQTGQEDQFFTTAGDPVTEYGVAQGVAVRWNSGASSFGTLTHNVIGTESYVTNGFSSRVLLRKNTFATTETYSGYGRLTIISARTTEEGRSKTIGYEVAGGPTRMASCLAVKSVGLCAAGARAQLPPALGYSATEGLNYGGAELFYPIVSVEGATLRTPIMSPITTLRTSGASRSTYSYDDTLGGVRGTSVSGSTASAATFSSSFAPPSPQSRVFGTKDGDAINLTSSPDGFLVAGAVATVGNREAWTGIRGAISIYAGALRITTESKNTTGSVAIYYDTAKEVAVGETQAAIEPGWAASRGSSTYSIVSHARITALASQHLSFTA